MPKNQQKISKFILKLSKILQEPKYHESIKWTEDGTGVQIKNRKQLEITILSEHFKLKKVTSFIRQLHLYGFYKTRNHNRVNTFEHPFFKKQLGENYCLIKRKYNVKKTQFSKQSLQSFTNEAKNIQKPIPYPELCSFKSFPLILNNQEQKPFPNELAFEEWYLNKDEDLSLLLDDCFN